MASRSRGWSSTRQLEIANCCARLGRRGRRLPLASSLSIRDLIPASLRTLPRDGVLLFVSRFTRLFAYGALSVILVFYLVSLGLSEAQVGVLLTLTLAGDMAISLLLTTQADRIGRRRMLIVGAILMAGAGVLIHTRAGPRGSRYVCDASQWSIRKGLSRCWSFPLDCFEVIELVRPRLLRWWFCSAKLCRILVLSAIRGSSGEARPHFLLGQCVGGNLGAARIALGDAYRARADDGGDAFAVECFAHSCAAYAEPQSRGAGAACPIQHQPY